MQNYGDRRGTQYDSPAYEARSRKVKRRLLLTKSMGVCPFCLRPTRLGMYREHNEIRLKNNRWLESHHLHSHWHWTLIGACNHCHTGKDGNRRRSLLHHPAVWKQYRDHRMNHNAWWVCPLLIVWYWCIVLAIAIFWKLPIYLFNR